MTQIDEYTLKKATKIMNAIEKLLIITIVDALSKTEKPVNEEQARNIVAKIGTRIMFSEGLDNKEQIDRALLEE